MENGSTYKQNLRPRSHWSKEKLSTKVYEVEKLVIQELDLGKFECYDYGTFCIIGMISYQYILKF